jgi:hypothetical protein
VRVAWLGPLVIAGCGRVAFEPTCERPNALCDSFDEVPLGARWSERSEVGGQLSLQQDDAMSPPSALMVDVAGGTSPNVTLTERLVSAPRVSCSFAFRIRAALAPAPSPDISFFFINDGDNGVELGISSDGTITLWEVGTDASGTFFEDPLLVTAIARDVWIPITVDTDATAATAAAASGAITRAWRSPGPAAGATKISLGAGNDGDLAPDLACEWDP